MKKTKKLAVLLTSLLLASCSNLTPDQISSIGDILKTSASPSIKISPSPSALIQKISLDGTVYDSSKVRVDGVTVKINGQTTVTDSTGHYFFPDLLLGTTSIILSRDGFNDYVEQQELKEKSQTINFTVTFTSKPQIAVNGQAFLPTIIPSTSNLKTSFDGYLRQEGTDKPLANTALKIGTVSAITDSRGYFIFPDIPMNSNVLLEYLNGLDKEPSQQPISLVSGVNSLILYYHTNQPQPTPTPTVFYTPYPTARPTIIYTPQPTPTSTSTSINNQDYDTKDVTGIWKLNYVSKYSTFSFSQIVAIKKNIVIGGGFFYGSEILQSDENDAINGKVRTVYFGQGSQFILEGLAKDDGTFSCFYNFYNYPLTKTGQYYALYEFTRPTKTHITGTYSTKANDNFSAYTFEGERLRGDFVTTSSSQTVDSFNAKSMKLKSIF